MDIRKTLLIINGAQFGYSAGHYYYCKYLKDIYNIQYICFDRELRKIELEGVKVHYISFTGNRFLRMFRFLIQIIYRSNLLKPDVLFVVFFNYCFILSILCKSSQKILDIRTGSLALNKKIRDIDNFWLMVQSFLFKKRIILSEGLKKHLKIPFKNTLVLPLGAEIYYEGRHNFEYMHLIYVGLLDRRNIFETVEGISIFLKQYPDKKDKLVYTIIGWGDSLIVEKLKSTIEITKLKEIIHLEGMKNYDDLAEYFKVANIGVAYVPTVEYYQNQPVTKIFEYMLSGMPVIATNTNENKLLINSMNGVLCDDTSESFAEALVLLARNQYDSDDIRNSMMEYHWKNLVENKLKIFLETD